MNRESQKRKIRRFLEGKSKKDIDAFCIYQWIDRCHYEGWFDFALALTATIPPNSLNNDYHKRLAFLLNECRKNLNSLEKEFTIIGSPDLGTKFMLSKSFMETCKNLNLKIKGKHKRGLCFQLFSTEILFIQNMDLRSCVICFYMMRSEGLRSWLNSHGFDFLIQGIINDDEDWRLKLSWHDAENLLSSYIFDMESTGIIFTDVVFEAIIKVKNGTWGKYLNYIKEKYSILPSNESIESIRKDLIESISKKNYESKDEIIKRLETD